jgi:ferredoxin
MDSPVCLWMGSPVYVAHIVPPVELFLRNLPTKTRCYVVPFVTWGGVSSGVALAEMGEIVCSKGHVLLGAAKVLALHSSMWQSSRPLGEGHPGPEEDAAIQNLVDHVHGKLSSDAVKPLPLESLHYQPDAVKEDAARKSIATAKQITPELAVDEEKCSQCGECAAKCPAEAIRMNPYPHFGEECFICLKCVRECPQGAILLDMSGTEERLRGMALAHNETPPTRIFL